MNNGEILKEIRSAIKQGNTGRFMELIRSHMETINTLTPFGTWLHVASSEGQLEIVKELVRLGADVNRPGGLYGGGALNEAASEGHLEVVEYLLSCGADMDVSEPERNPLFGAISNGHEKIAALLIKKGIQTRVKYNGDSKSKRDALSFAKEEGQVEIVKMLESVKEDTEPGIIGLIPNSHAEILEHVAKYLGSPTETLSEIIPGSRVAVQIHIIPPSKERNYKTLVTTGMSDYPMDDSEKANDFKHAELLIKLPADWPVSEAELTDTSKYWPIAWLRRIAHIPHRFEGWLTDGVILPNGEPPKPFAPDTKLSCVMISKVSEKGLEKVKTSKGDIVNLYALIPIYQEERKLALKKGYDHLIGKMNENKITDVLDIHRVNAAK